MQKGLGKRIFIEKVVTELNQAPIGSFVSSTRELAKKQKVDYIIKYLGSGVENKDFKVGQKVYLGAYTPELQDIEGEKLLIVKEDDVIAIL